MSEKAEMRRKQILRAAFNAVADKGFYYVTLQDFADYAGVSKGVTSYYFKNKEDVLSHLFLWVTARIYDKEITAVNAQETALEKLQAYVDAAFIGPRENRNFYKVYLDFLSHATRNDSFRKVNEQFYENCWSIGREIVSLGKQEGIFSDRLDVEKAAAAIRAAIDGAMIQWLMRDDDTLHRYYRDICLEAVQGYLTSAQ